MDKWKRRFTKGRLRGGIKSAFSDPYVSLPETAVASEGLKFLRIYIPVKNAGFGLG